MGFLSIACTITIVVITGSVYPAFCRAWVYAFVPADYGGDLLLPHFISYYHQLGITYGRFLVLIHHDPRLYDRRALNRLTGICSGYSLECRIWEGRYTADRHMEQQLLMLRDFVFSPYDWIITANVDEFQDWPTSNLNRFLTSESSVLNRSSTQSPSFYVGNVFERIAVDGTFPTTLPQPSIFNQFPYVCEQKGYGKKIVAFKNFLRPGRSQKRIIIPDLAQDYFSACTEKSTTCLRPSLNQGDMARDLYDLTPYSKYYGLYKYYENIKGESVHSSEMLDVVAATRTEVGIHRIKHGESLNQTRDFLLRYRGNCTLSMYKEDLNVMGSPCLALLPDWKQRAEELVGRLAGQREDVSSIKCKFELEQKGVDAVDTAYEALAWDEFEGYLQFVSKFRTLGFKEYSVAH